ncbi:CHASE domain-containing protein [Zhongshania aquimaris]|uniref:histidine kinase n=1 Tax=Zhongshania aquimaris TaxID=2857107 RepID=A0ABS6VS51_9GAMM|nr:CHASE domain-containing protein [Zhongshania aquimaris]MBW2941134.1 CHASE domain-containing protein [Zhongshania aquimaris]
MNKTLHHIVRHIPSWGLFVSGLAISSFLAYEQSQHNKQRIVDEVARYAKASKTYVEERVELYQYGLRGARGVVLAADIDRDKFTRYSATRDVPDEFPGARGFGFIRRVPADQEQTFLEAARADGWPNFQIKQLSTNDDDRFVIQYIEPVERNHEAVGLDIASETNRRVAAIDSMQSGEVRLTGPITLVQASGKTQRSFLILMPAYASYSTPETEEQRIANLVGWSYAPLLMDEVLADLRLKAEYFTLQLFDITDAESPTRFFESEQSAPEPKLTDTRTIRVFGRVWQQELLVKPAFIDSLALFPGSKVLGLGAIISFLLATLLGVLSAQRQIRQQVIEEQEKLAKIVESSADTIIGTDLNGVINSWNFGATENLGFSRSEAIGASLFALVKESGVQNMDTQSEESTAENSAISYDALWYCKTDTPIDVAVTRSPFVISGTNTTGYSWLVKNITVQKAQSATINALNIKLDEQVKRRTSELTELNSLLQNIMDSASGVAIITTHLDGVVRFFNAGAENLLGYSSEEVVNKASIQSFILRKDLELRSKELGIDLHDSNDDIRVLTHLATEKLHERREWRFRKNGDAIFVGNVAVSTMLNEANSPSGYLIIATDVTKESQHRRDIEASNSKILQATTVAELGVWTWTLEDNSLDWNDKMFALYEWPTALNQNGLNYEHWRSRVHPEDVEAAEKSLHDAIAELGEYDPIFRLSLPSGNIRYIQARGALERDVDGSIIKVAGFNRDITSEVELERNLRQAKELAESASSAKSSFLANMSHDIRTPLNAVLGMLQLLQQSELNDRQNNFVNRAATAANSLLLLLNDILDYSKIEANKIDLAPRNIDLDLLMQEVIAIIAGSGREKNIAVLFDIPSVLPGLFFCDDLRLKQVLMNLLSNAIKFTNEGHVILRVKVCDKSLTHSTLEFSVEDSGIGIEKSMQGRIFSSFQQAEDSTSRRFGGSGLGLSISQRLINMMGGEISVNSQLGQGSVFKFSLSLPYTSFDNKTYTSMSLSGYRILLAQSNSLYRNNLQQMLDDFGATVVTVHSEADFINELVEIKEGNTFSAAIIDAGMLESDTVQYTISLLLPGKTAPRLIATKPHKSGEVTAWDSDHGRGLICLPATPKQICSLLEDIGDSNLAEKKLTPGVNSVSQLRDLTILVVDDTEINLVIATEMLKQSGATVTAVSGGKAAIRKLNDGLVPDLILMDMEMPDINGLETTRIIRNMPQYDRVPILAMTANVFPTDIDACLEAGMSDHIAKPINFRDAISKIKFNIARISRA